jgi:O-antigen ligase
MISRHRVALGALLAGNAVLFAGVDPPTRWLTTLVVLLLVVDLRRLPDMPRTHRLAAFTVAGLVVAQLVPLPEVVRRLVQPGFASVMTEGWAPLSLAPWATLQTGASIVVAVGIALTAARMAATRSGLPVLLTMLAATGVILAILGLAGEAGAPAKVLLIRDNTGGGGPYGPYVNDNHFAQGVELTIPAALVLLAVGIRQLRESGGRRQLAAVMVLGAAVATVVVMAALFRSGSRGGALFLVAALLLTFPLWLRPRRFRRRVWPGVVVGILLLVLIGVLSWTRLPELEEGFRDLLVVEGVDGNSRWDFWTATLRSGARSPLVGSGLGSYRHVISLDKPATGASVLEQAHNDWLEWFSTTGLVGTVALVLFVVGVVLALAPAKVRTRRFENRYPLAGIALALAATALHEAVGFGLQTPINRYLLAVWIGMLWGLQRRRQEQPDRATPDVGDRGESE